MKMDNSHTKLQEKQPTMSCCIVQMESRLSKFENIYNDTEKFNAIISRLLGVDKTSRFNSEMFKGLVRVEVKLSYNKEHVLAAEIQSNIIKCARAHEISEQMKKDFEATDTTLAKATVRLSKSEENNDVEKDNGQENINSIKEDQNKTYTNLFIVCLCMVHIFYNGSILW